jgi:hypothetical protein
MLTLRPYQQEAIEAMLAAEVFGVRRPLLALPTGCGKTVIFAHLIRQRGGRSLSWTFASAKGEPACGPFNGGSTARDAVNSWPSMSWRANESRRTMPEARS